LMSLLQQHYECSNAEDETNFVNRCAELKKVAGYHLYTELLVNLGFPREHILCNRSQPRRMIR